MWVRRGMIQSRHLLQLMGVALLCLAVVAINSAAMNVGEGRVDPLTLIWGKHTLYAILAIAAMGLASQLDIRQIVRCRGWTNPLPWLILLSLGLVGLTFVPGMGKSVNGASRWLFLGPRQFGISFQPSELVKWVMVLSIAWWCTRRTGVMGHFRHGLMPILSLVAVAVGLIVVEDLGTGALIGLVAVVLLAAGGAKIWQLLLLTIPGVVAMGLLIVHSPYRWARLTAFLDPWADPLGTGYHPIQSMLTISQGGLTGRGLGNGLQKFGYLPEDTTDFVFAIICEELGLAGAALVIGIYLIILWLGFGIARDCKSLFARLFTLGVLITLGAQTVINLAVVTVVAPTKGIALPLVSAGGTGWILTAFALGLVAGQDQVNELEAKESEEGLAGADQKAQTC